ncbi:DoxX family protein [Streptomyces aurantiacus]|uniref:Putative oxidoreductase MhqP n=1 Tax=Streptomyces aurantiacus JA 4570 TaxID=1286094 RepID=S3ZCE8_9ACTN|nr:DoxX family protein [Streptomyces aurantiacus]EPH40803.1 putative oxidoreductase MhqP [Streptomyces aurantiacus JA 4570]
MSSPSTTPTPAGTPHRHGASPALASQPGADIGLLLLRLAVGLTMAAHGSQKLFGWFDGSGLDDTAAFFAADGYKAAKAMAWVAALTETLCGLGLAIGLLTPLAGAGILGIMLNAIAVKWGGGFFSPEGIEYDLVLLAGAVSVALTGPGRLAADALLPGLRDHRFSRGAAAVVLGAVSAAFVLVVLRD